jgi:hypothetical protein
MYVDIRADGAKCSVFVPSPPPTPTEPGSVRSTGEFEMTDQCAGTVTCQV